MAEEISDDEGRWRLERHMTRIFLRPIGNPLPLGFLGLAAATIVLSGLELGWVPATEHRHVGLVMVAFTFPVQLLAAVFGYLGRDPVGGTGNGVLAGTWLTVGLLQLTSPTGSRSATLGLFLFVAAAALLPAVVAASIGKVLPGVVMGLTALRWALVGVFEKTGGHGWRVAGGWEGVALCLVALYTALALEVEGALRHTVLPLGRRGLGRVAVSGGVRAEISGIEREPGVREQL